MKLIGFKTIKPRKFNYKPQFYSPEQEEFEQRLHRSRLSEQPDPEHEVLRIKMQQSWKLKEQREKKRAGIRNLMIALFLIILLIYFIFF
jgi:uncharacterized membrane protein